MVFYKQYLLTITCIVITAWVIPTSAEFKETEAEANCVVILVECGFTNGTTIADAIQAVDYITAINNKTKGASNELTEQTNEFVINTGVYKNIDDAASKKNLTVTEMIKIIAMKLSNKYKEKNKGKYDEEGSEIKTPVTTFCSKYIEHDTDFEKDLFTTD
uniref:Uncharacterized protein n=1 Tax=Acyrthosiphon pisum TaxID=7029 RepID=C4WXE8_ACYPI|nr:hypothetical protein [Acyrthosiphon pisum]